MLKKLLASVFVLEKAAHFLTLVLSLTLISQGDNDGCRYSNKNNTKLPLLCKHCYSQIVLVDNEGDPIQTRESTEYGEILIDWDGSMKWHRRKKLTGFSSLQYQIISPFSQ
jgi:hypothetical protein